MTGATKTISKPRTKKKTYGLGPFIKKLINNNHKDVEISKVVKDLLEEVSYKFVDQITAEALDIMGLQSKTITPDYVKRAVYTLKKTEQIDHALYFADISCKKFSKLKTKKDNEKSAVAAAEEEENPTQEVADGVPSEEELAEKGSE